MRAIARLKHDHQELRLALAAMESALEGEAEAQGAFREASERIAKRLRGHSRSESRLAVRCSRKLGKIGQVEMAWLAIEHVTDWQVLNAIRRRLTHQGDISFGAIRSMVVFFIDGMRRCMEAQENTLFPFIEEVFHPRFRYSASPENGASPLPAQGWLVGSMGDRGGSDYQLEGGFR